VYAQRVTVHYVDGTRADLTLTQWSIGQFGLWAARQGLKADMSSPGLLAITMLRFQAWAELHRTPRPGAGARPSFDTWDATVAEVEPEGSAEVDPTQPAPSAD
jgi:hypothetical protein